MSTWLFYLNQGVMMLSIFAGAISFSAYTVSRRKTYLGASIFSVVYFFDVALMFRPYMAEENPSGRFVDIFVISSPPESIMLGCALICLLWYTAFMYLSLRPIWIAIPTLLFVALSVIILVAEPERMWREFIFFSMRAVGFMSLLCFLIIYYFVCKDTIKRFLLKKHLILFIVSGILCIGTVLWNIYFMIILPSLSSGKEPFLPERNFIENLFILFISWYISFRGVGILRLHINEPPSRERASDEEVIANEAAIFTRKYKLSPTENKVLLRMVQGETNRQIAEAMFIELTTVKVHVHNILKKTGKTSRNEVISDFWHSM